MAEIKHEDIVRAVRLAADIEYAALKIAQQKILINRLSAELKEAQSIAEQMLDIVLEKQKAEKSQAEPEKRITSVAECVERFANAVIYEIKSKKDEFLNGNIEFSYGNGYERATDTCSRIVKDILRDFMNEQTAVKE